MSTMVTNYDIRTLKISSTNPCLIVYLLDQSGSMSERFGNANHAKSVEVARAINEIIYEVALRCNDNGTIKDRFELAVIGYGKKGDHITPAWEGNLANHWVQSISKIYASPLGIEDDLPYWIKPYSSDATPMKKAFENALLLCEDWIEWGNHKDCYPPIIINITDGQATDDSSPYRGLRDVVDRLRSLRTHYGTTNVFNIHISSLSGDRILFPSEVSQNGDGFARLLFELSTPLNEHMMQEAKKRGYTNITEGARGYVFNGNNTDLLNFLNIGSNPF